MQEPYMREPCMHVLIIGGGVIGLMTALELAQSNCKVTILDSQDFGKAASWAGGGILSPMYPWRYPAAVNQLARLGKQLYQEWQPILQQATGLDIEINPSGMLILDDGEFDNGLNWALQDNDPQQTAQLLSNKEIHNVNPKINADMKQALWFEQLANIRNPRLLKVLIAYLKQLPNVSMHSFVAAKEFKIINDTLNKVSSHRINGLIDAQGKSWHADHYVIANGAWTGLLGQQLPKPIPVKPIQGQMILFKASERWLPSMVMHNGIYLIPRLDGHIVCGSSADDVGFNTDLNTTIHLKLKHAAYQMIPELKDMPIVHAWAGLRPSVPDGIPYIGAVPQFDNLWLNTGHFRNGLVMAPASARLLKQQMLGEPLIVNDTAYLPVHRLN